MKSFAAAVLSLLLGCVAYGQEQYERILVPIGAYNLSGAYGSLWQTELTGFNTGEAFIPVKVSLSEVCALPEGCPDTPAQPHQVFSLVVGAAQGGFFSLRGNMRTTFGSIFVFSTRRVRANPTERCCR